MELRRMVVEGVEEVMIVMSAHAGGEGEVMQVMGVPARTTCVEVGGLCYSSCHLCLRFLSFSLFSLLPFFAWFVVPYAQRVMIGFFTD